ncbi:hypothetical protein BH09VER1_BH09VER1_06320 [soil metagenome]
MSRSKSSNQAFTGIFLVGLGIVGWYDYWWPGILFVIAAAMLVSALMDGRLGENLLTISVLLAIGVFGLLGQLHLGHHVSLWPILFVAIGLAYLVKTFWKRGS